MTTAHIARYHRARPVSPVRQQGAALLVSLIILLVMTLLALSGMQGASLQERMVSAQRDSQAALEGAEHALMEAEDYLSTFSNPQFDNSDGLYNKDHTDPGQKSPPALVDLFDPDSWTDTYSRTTTSPQLGGNAYLAAQPRFFIEELSADAISANNEQSLNTGQGYAPPGEVNATAYRIVAWSSGISGQSARVIEAHVFR